ncbi:MAG: cell envelope integrity protein TolA [Nitrospirae bacterium]|nr:cell envelope integrity protein TolA [Nitrospirota bacterium]
MREPSLQRTTVLSLTIHLSAIFITILILKQSNTIVIPSPYVVSLVSPANSEASHEKLDLKTSVLSDTQPISEEKTIRTKEMKEEKIAAIEAKKKIEKIVKLRSIISLKAGEKNPDKISNITQGTGTLFDDYYAKITNEIRQQWIFPDSGPKNIEAIISIKILKDGTIINQKVEKSSGNTLFDRSALKAIAKANPLTPPPYEMEIGVRFYP